MKNRIFSILTLLVLALAENSRDRKGFVMETFKAES
jgi:hypothetical protein